MEFTVQGKTAYAYTGGKPFDAGLPVLVFVHGAQLDHCDWGLQSRYFAHHGWGVLALDLPGHGRSAGEPLGSIEEIADWLAALLDAAGVARAAIAGHSMGSLAALDCAARHPQRVSRIALVSAAFPMRVSPDLLAATREDEPRAQKMVNIWSHAGYAQVPGNPGPGFWVMGGNLRLMQRQKPGVMQIDFAACNDYAAGAQRAAQVRCPALFVLGRRDVMTPARMGRDLARTVPDARVVEVAGGGHALMGEKPDEVLDALIEFLAPATGERRGATSAA